VKIPIFKYVHLQQFDQVRKSIISELKKFVTNLGSVF